MNSYKIAILSLLAALAIVGRIAFSFWPNVQPATALIIICGISLGPISALILSMLIIFLSNIVLGTGLWTAWQIVSWGIIGVLSGFLGKYPKKLPIAVIIVFSIFSGYFFGFIMSVTNYFISGQGFWAYYLAGLPFDTNHAIGNAMFVSLFYPIITHLLQKYASNHFSLQKNRNM